MSTVQYTLRKPTKKCCPSHVHCTILAMSTVQNPFRQPAKNCCPSHVHCNILLDKLPKNVVLHTTKSILAWKNVNKIKLHFELKQTWENFTIIVNYKKQVIFTTLIRWWKGAAVSRMIGCRCHSLYKGRNVIINEKRDAALLFYMS